MRFKFLILGLSLFFLLGLFIYEKTVYFDGKLHVVFCDVGQGDAIFIRTPGGADILVDAGPDDKILTCLSRHMPFWDHDLELLFATHPDADHISGFENVLKSFTVKSFNTSKKSKNTAVFARIQKLIDDKKIPFHYVFAGDSFAVSDGVEIRVDWPTRKYADNDIAEKLDANSFSLVQTVEFGKFKVLLTGDIESEFLNKIYASGLSIDVLKLPHHGSKTGVDDKTFELIKPGLSIISAGKNNRYHHPSPETISLLKKYNISYKITFEKGDIEIISDGQSSRSN